jgi:hypothetical protein
VSFIEEKLLRSLWLKEKDRAICGIEITNPVIGSMQNTHFEGAGIYRFQHSLRRCHPTADVLKTTRITKKGEITPPAVSYIV